MLVDKEVGPFLVKVELLRDKVTKADFDALILFLFDFLIVTHVRKAVTDRLVAGLSGEERAEVEEAIRNEGPGPIMRYIKEETMGIFDPSEEDNARIDEIEKIHAYHRPFAFIASHEDATGSDDEIIYRSAPGWAWTAMDNMTIYEKTVTDTMRKEEKKYRAGLQEAFHAMVLSCERGDDQPISREEAREALNHKG